MRSARRSRPIVGIAVFGGLGGVYLTAMLLWERLVLEADDDLVLSPDSARLVRARMLAYFLHACVPVAAGIAFGLVGVLSARSWLAGSRQRGQLTHRLARALGLWATVSVSICAVPVGLWLMWKGFLILTG